MGLCLGILHIDYRLLQPDLDVVGGGAHHVVSLHVGRTDARARTPLVGGGDRSGLGPMRGRSGNDWRSSRSLGRMSVPVVSVVGAAGYGEVWPGSPGLSLALSGTLGLAARPARVPATGVPGGCE